MTLTAARQAFLEEFSGSPKPLLPAAPPVHTLTIAEAKEWAENVVRALPKGTEFTSMRLLGRVRLRGDARVRGAVIKHLQRARLIHAAGFTTEDQEGRNNGYAVKWRVNEW